VKGPSGIVPVFVLTMTRPRTSSPGRSRQSVTAELLGELGPDLWQLLGVAPRRGLVLGLDLLEVGVDLVPDDRLAV